MNKSLLSLGLVAVLGMCSLSAGEADCKKPNNQEMEFLFGTNAKASDINVAVLSDEEMKEVQGEFLAALGANILIGLGAYGLCGVINGFKNCGIDIPMTEGGFSF